MKKRLPKYWMRGWGGLPYVFRTRPNALPSTPLEFLDIDDPNAEWLSSDTGWRHKDLGKFSNQNDNPANCDHSASDPNFVPLIGGGR